jgi:hypothetical protein
LKKIIRSPCRFKKENHFATNGPVRPLANGLFCWKLKNLKNFEKIAKVPFLGTLYLNKFIYFFEFIESQKIEFSSSRQPCLQLSSFIENTIALSLSKTFFSHRLIHHFHWIVRLSKKVHLILNLSQNPCVVRGCPASHRSVTHE